MNDLIPLGSRIRGLGTVAAIHSKGGDRCYFVLGDEGTVTLIPADLIDPADVEHETRPSRSNSSET